MSTPKRIYEVTHKPSAEPRLVRATNQAQALRHVVRDTYEVVVASQDRLVSLVQQGRAVEDAAEVQD